MVKKVPHKILEVKQKQTGQHASEQAGDAGGFPGQVHRPPVPMQHRHWQDEHQVVVEAAGHAALDAVNADGVVRLDLPSSDERNPHGEPVQQHVGQAKEEVDAEREQHGEERRAHETFMPADKVPGCLE